MNTSKKYAPVALTPCSDYEKETVRSALSDLLTPLGGLNWVTPGMTVGIKANLVSAMSPEEAATTHPALLCALTRMLKAKGAGRVIIGDSPGGLYTAAFVNHVYNVSGMAATLKSGAELNQNFDTTDIAFPEARVLRFFSYTAWLDECDAIIDFCKLKSHGMMGMSSATKNLFGVIPGAMKPEYHFRFPNMRDFSNMLVDINEYFSDKVKLCLVDAVEGMEGNGPTKGTPRHIGLLLASASPHVVDLLSAHIIGLSPDAVPTLISAHERGLIPADAAELDVIITNHPIDTRCDALEKLTVRDFAHVAVRHSLLFESHGKLVGKILQALLSSRPKLHASACVGCGKCANICPARAIALENKKAVIDRSKCIRCFCCQEFCPTGAMKVHRTVAARMLARTKNKSQSR